MWLAVVPTPDEQLPRRDGEIPDHAAVKAREKLREKFPDGLPVKGSGPPDNPDREYSKNASDVTPDDIDVILVEGGSIKAAANKFKDEFGEDPRNTVAVRHDPDNPQFSSPPVSKRKYSVYTGETRDEALKLAVGIGVPTEAVGIMKTVIPEDTVVYDIDKGVL